MQSGIYFFIASSLLTMQGMSRVQIIDGTAACSENTI